MQSLLIFCLPKFVTAALFLEHLDIFQKMSKISLGQRLPETGVAFSQTAEKSCD
jgi:hypothetical protein